LSLTLFLQFETIEHGAIDVLDWSYQHMELVGLASLLEAAETA
jgi:hypothetical protein